MSRKNEPASKFKSKQYSFETVKAFIYLGFKPSSNNSTSLTIDERIQAANKSYMSLIKLFKSKLPKDNKNWLCTKPLFDQFDQG